MNIGARIRYWREHLGIRPSDLARAVGVSSAAVSQWERAKDSTEPTHENLAAIVGAFGISLSEFWGALPKRRAS